MLTETITIVTVLSELREFRAENEKRWEQNERRWQANDKKWEKMIKD